MPVISNVRPQKISMRSKTEVSFRLAVRGDSLCLSALATQVFLDTYAAEGINTWLAREVEVNCSAAATSRLLERAGTKFILAEGNGNLLGFAQLSEGSTHELVANKSAVEIDRLYVQEPFTSKGIGAALLRQSEILAFETGANTLWLTAWVGNQRALRFYTAQNYRDLGSTSYTFEGQSFENRLFAKALPNASAA